MSKVFAVFKWLSLTVAFATIQFAFKKGAYLELWLMPICFILLANFFQYEQSEAEFKEKYSAEEATERE